MTTAAEGFADRLRAGRRIIWAIASKDIVMAIKNRTTLANMIIVLLMILVFRWLPNLIGQDDRFLIVYDAGDSRLLAELENHPQFKPLRATSMQRFEELLDDLDVHNLGLVIPSDYDQIADTGAKPVLDGYFVWSNRFAVDDLRSDYERRLSELAGQSIGIDVKEAIYPVSDSMGATQMASVIFVIVILFVGSLVVPQLMFEEKQSRTLDALLVSPASIGQAVAGKALAGVFYVVTSVLAALVFYSAFVVNWGLAGLAFFGGLLLSVGIGLLLGILLESRQQMMLWTWLVFPPLILPVFLAGLDPILPEVVRAVIRWVPTVALAKVLRISFSSGAPLAQFAPELALMFGFAGLVLAAVVWVVRRSDR